MLPALGHTPPSPAPTRLGAQWQKKGFRPLQDSNLRPKMGIDGTCCSEFESIALATWLNGRYLVTEAEWRLTKYAKKLAILLIFLHAALCLTLSFSTPLTVQLIVSSYSKLTRRYRMLDPNRAWTRHCAAALTRAGSAAARMLGCLLRSVHLSLGREVAADMPPELSPVSAAHAGTPQPESPHSTREWRELRSPLGTGGDRGGPTVAARVSAG